MVVMFFLSFGAGGIAEDNPPELFPSLAKLEEEEAPRVVMLMPLVPSFAGSGPTGPGGCDLN